MHILVLSVDPTLYSTRRITESGRARGHAIEVVDYRQCCLELLGSAAQVVVGTERLRDWDAIIPRVGAGRTPIGVPVVRHFEAAGTYCLNSSEAISRSRNKLQALQQLVRSGLQVPATACTRPDQPVDAAIAAVGGAPLVVKLTEGTRGAGVILAETHEAARSIVTALHMLEGEVMVQRLVTEAMGTDIRALVVGDQVVASMMRVAPPGEFRANLYRGATAEPIQLSEHELRLSVAAAQAVGLQVAGVDFLRTEHGPLFLEVNSSPGLEGIERCTGVDVADRMIRLMESEYEASRDVHG